VELTPEELEEIRKREERKAQAEEIVKAELIYD